MGWWMIEGLEPSPPHDGPLERIHHASVQAPLPAVGVALRAIALGLSQLADALDPITPHPGASRSGHHSVRVRDGS